MLNYILCSQAADYSLSIAHDLLDHILGLGQVGDALCALARTGHRVVCIALVGRSNALALKGEQLHGDAGEIVGYTDIGAGASLAVL